MLGDRVGRSVDDRALGVSSYRSELGGEPHPELRRRADERERPAIVASSIETTVVVIVWPASARAWIALSKLAKASGDIRLLRASESPAAKAWTTMS